MNMGKLWYHFAHLVITNLAVILTCGQSVILALFFDWDIYFTPEQTFLHQNLAIHTVFITYWKCCENLKFIQIIYTIFLVKGFFKTIGKGFTLQKTIMYHTVFSYCHTTYLAPNKGKCN